MEKETDASSSTKSEEQDEFEENFEIVEFDPSEYKVSRLTFGQMNSMIMSLLKSFNPSLGQDFTKLSLPAHVCFPASMLELASHEMAGFLNLLEEASQEKEAEFRFLKALQFFLCRTPYNLLAGRKPLNPVLGETFNCQVLNEKGEPSASWISEQVSHHPPVSAFYVRQKQGHYSLRAHFQTDFVFHGTYFKATPEAESVITLDEWKEDYIGEHPGLMLYLVRGACEWVGPVKMECPQTKWSAHIEFKSKPVFYGKWHSIEGTISHDGEKKYEFSGQWNEEVKFQRLDTKETSVLKRAEQKKYSLKPESKDEKHSARIWGGVRSAMLSNDLSKASKHKSKVEDEQRKLRKDTTHFSPKYFKRREKSWLPRRKPKIPTEKTN